MRKIITLVLGIAVLIGFSVVANAKTLKCQTVVGAKSDKVVMLKEFFQTVTALTGGSLKFEVFPGGTVVGMKETLDAVDKGLLDCGFAWTHYWSGEHPAAMLDRKSTRLNSSHVVISYAVFCLKKKKKTKTNKEKDE